MSHDDTSLAHNFSWRQAQGWSRYQRRPDVRATHARTFDGYPSMMMDDDDDDDDDTSVGSHFSRTQSVASSHEGVPVAGQDFQALANQQAELHDMVSLQEQEQEEQKQKLLMRKRILANKQMELHLHLQRQSQQVTII